MKPLLDIGLPEEWVGVGGTLTALAAICAGVPWTEKTQLHGYSLEQDQVYSWLYKLADMPLEERLKLRGIQPQRADIIVHGIAILVASMEILHISRITVSEFGNLDGYIKQKYLI